MTYLIYYTARAQLTLPAESESAARLKAFQLLAAGFVVWRISGPDGFSLDRAHVEADYVKYELRT